MFQEYLEATEIVDWQNPEILKLAQSLSLGQENPEGTAKACFQWVRDEIYHSIE